MDNQLYIHIGCHKTGTSWLQECVFNKMKDLTYIYKERDFGRVDDYHKHCAKVLLSDEELSESIPHRGSPSRALARLAERYPDAKIIVGEREYVPWFKSCYSQYIKSGGTMSFKKYYGKYFMDKYWTPMHIALYCCTLWKDVYMYSHEGLIKKPEETITGICSFLGCDVPEWENKIVNASLKNVKLWRVINIIMFGTILRKYIESPYWILTAIPRRLKK